ncbi:MAG: Smr/MutS family protein [Alphaproteobacteria bacterium]
MAKKKSDPPETPDDNALFRAAMADAKPLDRRHQIFTEEITAPPATPARKKFTPRPPPQPASAASPVKPLETGTAADLDRRTMDKLRKGRLRPETRIDLHGMTASRAHSALNQFLANAHGAGKRCVLVITGKGSLKEGGGVIRRELPAWLNAPGNRTRILGFAQAQPGDGGGGAFYVLLKRRR